MKLITLTFFELDALISSKDLPPTSPLKIVPKPVMYFLRKAYYLVMTTFCVIAKIFLVIKYYSISGNMSSYAVIHDGNTLYSNCSIANVVLRLYK